MYTMNCTNPSAKNYNAAATTDDGSCIYLSKIGDVCHAFQDVAPDTVTDQSFTLSWELKSNNWVFYHDYIPDYYVMTREKLYSLHTDRIYKNSEGPYGNYYGVVNPFFIDVAFPSKQEFTLNTVQWITSILDSTDKAKEESTLTHITAWNNYQCTGRIPLSSVIEYLEGDHRKIQGKWSFNDLRNALIDNDVKFLDTIFNNFSILTGVTSNELPWYEQQLLSDNFVVIRFEFNNTSNQKALVHDVEINADKSSR